MSYHDQPGGNPYPPPRDQRDTTESQYPPPPGEEDDRARAYHQRAPSSNSVTLPPISPYEQPYAQPPPGPNGYPQDPRVYRPDPYAQPPPGPYRDDRGYQGDYARGGTQQMAFSQSAPRQRTAIACRYCRRRKIRCSGFDQNPEGRCSNCQRFQQECIFTPVSSQAQAFVPAHAVYPHMRNPAMGADGRLRPSYNPQQGPPQVYGAHGQPLGPLPQQPQQPYTDYPMPSPTGSYSSYTDDRGQSESSRKRPQAEPHPSILPPPIPGQPYNPRQETATRRPAVEEDLRLPPVTPTGGPGALPQPPIAQKPASNYSPGSSTSSQSGLQPPQALPSMSRTPPPRTSPGGDRQDPMALGNIMEKRPDTGMDRDMLGRLGRKN